MGLQVLQISKARLRSPLLGAYHQGNEGKALKGPFLLDTMSYTVPLALIPAEERLETGATRGVQGPGQPWRLKRAAIWANPERAAPFTQIGPSQKWTPNSLETIH